MSLSELRKAIDRIDIQLVRLINDRLELALRTKKHKKEITDMHRRQQVVQKVLSFAQSFPMNHLGAEFYTSLYQGLIAESEKLQEKEVKLVGFQGEHGAYGDLAARTYDPGWVSIPCLKFSDVFRGVEEGSLDVGIVPVENTLEGAVNQVSDLLVERSLKIIAEIYLPIHHSLITLPDTEYREIRVVYSHPQALGQCRSFLERHKLEPRPYYDTAGAAKMLGEQRPAGAAAIANDICASIYNLQVVKSNIEDHPANATRFVIIGKTKNQIQGDKCSLVLVAKHEPGALMRVLDIFAKHNINLTRIASRPIPQNIENHSFLLDFEGSDQDKSVLDALMRVESSTVSCRLLGCYPAWRA